MRWLILLLLIVGCSSDGLFAGEPEQAQSALEMVNSGTRGVTVNFGQGTPASTIFDTQDFYMILDVANQGTMDLDANSCFIQVAGHDTGIMPGMATAQSCGDIEGKSEFLPEGGYDYLEFRTNGINLPDGAFEYKPSLNVIWCYNYETTAMATVCVDPGFYQITEEQKSCITQDVAMGGGQGAPIAVSMVGVENVAGKAVLEFTVRNVGGGQLLSPYADIKNCGGTGLDYDDFDTMVYDIDFSGGSLVKCSPRDNTLRLVNGQGKIICTYDIDGTTAFETPVIVNLQYSYMENIKQQISIVKTP